MVTIILSIAIMLAVAAALSIKVLLGREREVKRFGCGSFSPAGPAGLSGRAGFSGRAGLSGPGRGVHDLRRAGPGAASTTCGMCGAEEGEACRNEEDSLAAPSGDRDDFSRN
jgi:hypothetical protein